jgi:hypothetical protein
MLANGNATAKQVYDMLETFLGTCSEDRARGLRVSATEKIGGFFERLERASANVSALEQSGKFHCAKQLVFRFEGICRRGTCGHDRFVTPKIMRSKPESMRTELSYLL